jgi:hypothetical protein
MTTRKITRITIQTRQTTLVQPARVRCQQCGAEVSILSPESAAGALQTTPHEIKGLLESGELHTIEPAGEELICGNSLAESSADVHQSEGEGK